MLALKRASMYVTGEPLCLQTTVPFRGGALLLALSTPLLHSLHGDGLLSEPNLKDLPQVSFSHNTSPDLRKQEIKRNRKLIPWSPFRAGKPSCVTRVLSKGHMDTTTTLNLYPNTFMHIFI